MNIQLLQDKISMLIDFIKNNNNNSKYMKFCFDSAIDVQKFYKQFVAQYLIASTVEGDCIAFNKVISR